ncbi:hypothetical protein NL676_017550 [Syzygium grande]|nr:hypothetical protein NL676_017550 [Syzygium grande]
MDRRNSSPWPFTLPSFLLCLSLCTHLCIGTDKLDANQSLSGNQTLTSSSGNFALGFFTPGKDNPVTHSYSTELKISGGNLVIVNDCQGSVWSTNLSTSSSGSSSMVAVLGDDGNFALKDAPNSSVTLSQSFDHPMHTWLPGGKLGIDKRKNTSRLLTSWKNAKDPSTDQAGSWLPSQAWNLFWSMPRQQCEVYRLCRPYEVCSEQSEDICSCLLVFSISSPRDWNLTDWSGGCKRNSDLNCAANASNVEKNCFSLSFYLRLAATNIKDPSKKSNVTAIVAGSVSAAWRGSLIAFAYRDLRVATKNFSEKLGGGRFGSVFKGTLPDSSQIAVKKLESISQGEKQFRTERNSELSENGAIKFFPTWAARKIAEGDDLMDLLDPNLETNANIEVLTRICRVACWCVQDEETHRPSMGQVVQIQEGVLNVNLPQIPRALQLFLDNQEHVVCFTESSSSNQSSQTKSNTSTASLQGQNSSSSA